MPATLIALDDDGALLRGLRAKLATAGQTVATTRDGVEAARLLESGAFTSAFVGVSLPGLSGPQVWERCRRTMAGRPVAVALVAETEQQRIEMLARGEGDAVLVQPLTLHEVQETLLMLVGQEPAGTAHASTDSKVLHRGAL